MNLSSMLQDRSVLRLVQIALAEDIGTGDLTAESLVNANDLTHAVLQAKEGGVLAGSIVAGVVFGEVDRSIVCDWHVTEGDTLEPGTVIAHLHGPAQGILTAERTALNFLQRMSGVASLTRRYVDAVKGTGVTILDTRKTIPGWRILDKYAVKVGGGTNHRMGLYDMVMVKDNHIAAYGSIAGAVGAVRNYFQAHEIQGVGIEVETTTLKEVSEALSCPGVTRIMFDNFPLDLMKQGVVLVGNRVETEASGGVSLDKVREIAETGVQFISVGALTHSARALDISLTAKSR